MAAKLARDMIKVQKGNGWLYVRVGSWDRFWQWRA